MPELLPVLKEYYAGGLWHGLQHYSYFQDVAKLDVLANYRATDSPVLLLAGGSAMHAVDTTWANSIADAVNAARSGTANSIIFPHTTQHYCTVPSIPELVRMEQDGTLDDAYISEHFNRDVPRRVADWIKGRQ